MTRVTKQLAMAALAGALLLTAAPAMSVEPEVRLLFRADEPGGTVAVDASRFHNDGRLLGGVTRRNGVYRFHAISTRGHRYDRISVPFDSSLSPGRARFSYGARIRVAPDAEWSHREMGVLRHGDSNTSGGDYKLELKKSSQGFVVALCAMRRGSGAGSGYVSGRGRLASVADGQWHTVTCARRRNMVSLTIDGHLTSRPASGRLGSITAERGRLLIGAEFTKDGTRRKGQFVGLMDDIHVTVGSGTDN